MENIYRKVSGAVYVLSKRGDKDWKQVATLYARYVSPSVPIELFVYTRRSDPVENMFFGQYGFRLSSLRVLIPIRVVRRCYDGRLDNRRTWCPWFE